MIVSSAIDRRNPEYVAAQRRNIPLLHRGEMLAELLRNRSGIAICGTHGKTTTTAMIAAVLRAGDIDAAMMLGGIDGSLGTNAYDGHSPWFVTEADESDGSFAMLDPKIAVVTNIENDHLQSDDELPQLVRAFEEFLGEAARRRLRDHRRRRSARRVAGRSRAPGAHGDLWTWVRAPTCARATCARTDSASSFDAIVGDVVLGTVELNVPGAINVQNALAAIAVARELEMPFAHIADGLSAFRGVRRRFEILVRSDRIVLVDDYAHHPTAVARRSRRRDSIIAGRSIVAFQPHRYSRTRISRAISPMRSTAPIASTSRRSTPRRSRRFRACPSARSASRLRRWARA